jgi:hypothetical protein
LKDGIYYIPLLNNHLIITNTDNNEIDIEVCQESAAVITSRAIPELNSQEDIFKDAVYCGEL